MRNDRDFPLFPEKPSQFSQNLFHLKCLILYFFGQGAMIFAFKPFPLPPEAK